MERDSDEKLQKLIELERKLGEIHDVDVLLDRILTETRKIVNADAGSIYVVDGDKLKIKHSQNETQLRELPPGEKLPYIYFSFPINEHSIAGYVAISRKPLNIPNAYEIPESEPYKFNKSTDDTTHYITKSMYTFPLISSNSKLLGVLQVINAKNENGEVIPFDEEAELMISHFAVSAVQALQHAFFTNEMVNRILKMAEFRDPKETYYHVERVSKMSLEIYDKWAFNHNIPEDEQSKFRDTIRIAAKFHDVGKVGISDVILKKPSPRFTPEEREIMMGHSCIGAKLFENTDSFLDEMAYDVALHHHDRWDGGEVGYPGKINLKDYVIGEKIPEAEPLSGTDIPLAARIVAVADVFDALSNKRCYKDSWSVSDSFNEIQRNAGTQFDPEIVLAFMQIKDRICAIQMEYADEN